MKFRPDRTCRIRITSQNVPRLQIVGFSAAILYSAAILFFENRQNRPISLRVVSLVSMRYIRRLQPRMRRTDVWRSSTGHVAKIELKDTDPVSLS